MHSVRPTSTDLIHMHLAAITKATAITTTAAKNPKTKKDEASVVMPDRKANNFLSPYFYYFRKS